MHYSTIHYTAIWTQNAICYDTNEPRFRFLSPEIEISTPSILAATIKLQHGDAPFHQITRRHVLEDCVHACTLRMGAASWLSSENAKFCSRQNLNLFVSHSPSLLSRHASTCACHHQVLFFSKPNLCNSMYCQIIVRSFSGSVAWCIAVYRLPPYLLGFHILLAKNGEEIYDLLGFHTS